jgi:hypothetical protein
MSLGTDNLGKDKALVNRGKGIADGAEFNKSPYDLLDDLFHDDETQIVVGVRNKYISLAAQTFLEEMNLFFNESDLSLPILAVNLEDGVFKFIEHMEDKVSMELPVEWDTFEQDIRSYINANPIVRKEVQKNPENWDRPTGEDEPDLIDKSMQTVKDQVKLLQDKYNLTLDEVKETISKYKSKAVHEHNKTVYTAKGNAELQLKSGTYNHMVDLVKMHGWDTDFKEKYDKDIHNYMRSNEAEKGIEKRLLSEFGFEYCMDQISVDDNDHWNNRVIEVKFENQNDDDFDIDVDMSEFEDTENKNNIELNLNINGEEKTVRIRKHTYVNVVQFARYNKIYKDLSEGLSDKALEEYLNDNSDKEMSTSILKNLFGDYKDWGVAETPFTEEGKEGFDWRAATVIIGTAATGNEQENS